jgi:NAD(P)H-flavin reductase
MVSSPRLVTATLVSREFRAPGFWFLRFRAEHVARAARPAQFVALDLPGGFAVRLRERFKGMQTA